MSGLAKKIVIAALSTAAAVAVAWTFLRAPRSSAVVVIRDEGDAARSLLVERQRPTTAVAIDAAREIGESALVREPIPPDDALRLFRMGDEQFVYDPFTYYRFKGGMRRRLDFPEHDGGFFEQHTSEEGFIETFERLPQKRDLFVVVAGDSHTEGLCNTSETFANRLEALLAARHPERAIEVLNTGLTGYSFYQYLGVLEKMLPEKPDAFVVAFYGGNDFLDVVKTWHYFHHTSPPMRRADYLDKLRRGAAVSSSAVANAFIELLFFKYYPDQIDLSLAAAGQACAEIQRLCAEHGIALTFVYIPPGIDAGAIQPMVARAMEEIGLTDTDLQRYDRLADRLISELRARQATVFDLRQQFQPVIGDYYWSDLHINVKAHQRIAELLLPRIEADCPLHR